MEKTKLQWHPAFGAALRITLQDEMRYLEMQEEIYYLKGDPIPMQILIAPKLSDKENYWLQSMRTNLRAGAEIRNLYPLHKKSPHEITRACSRSDWTFLFHSRPIYGTIVFFRSRPTNLYRYLHTRFSFARKQFAFHAVLRGL